MPPDDRPSLPNITVQQLEYLVAVSRAPTWSRAAEHVGVSPSALSQGLAELERRVGIPLFDRVGRRRALTADADEVLRHAESVLGATADLGRWLDERRSGETGSVRLGMIDSAVTHHLREPLRAHVADRPSVQFQLRVAPSATLLSALERAELDAVVCVAPDVVPPRVAVRPLLEETMYVVAPRDPARVPPAAWGPWVGFPPDSHTRRYVEAALRSRGANLRVVAESHQPEVLLEMARLGIGWAVLPQTAVGEEASMHTQELCVRSLIFATRVGARPTAALTELIQQLTAA